MPKLAKNNSQQFVDSNERSASELRARKHDILNTWKERLQKQIPTVTTTCEAALLDSLPTFIDRLIDALAYSQSERDKIFQAGLTALEHGEQRTELPSYTLEQVLIEYRILREVIFDALKASGMLTESTVGAIDDTIQEGMSLAATEFLRIRMIRETQARRETETAHQRLKDLQNVTEAALAKSTSLQDLLYELLARVRHVFHSDTVVILLADEENQGLAVCAAHGLEDEVKKGMVIPFGRGIAGRVYAKKQAMIFDDLSQTEIYSPLLKEKALRSLMAAPLCTSHGSLGVIHIGSLSSRKFTESELSLLQMIGDRIAVAIENARLYDERKSDIASLRSEQNLRRRFISILSHDIRNPISAALMSATLLKRHGELPEVARKLSHRILEALARSDQLIQDLLDINKILSHETLSIERELTNLFNTVAEIVAKLSLSYGDRFILNGNRHISGKWGPRELSRLLELALGMGIRYGEPETPVLVSLTSTEHEAHVEIRFNGELQKPQSLTVVLSEDNAWAQAQKESRLSLEWALMNGFVQAHRGKLSLQSSKASGTEIKISLPLELTARD